MRFPFIILLFFCITLFSQENSKKNLLNSIDKTDSKEKTALLYTELAKSYRENSIDSAILYANKGYEIARSIKYTKAIAENTFLLGNLYVSINNIDKAQFYLNIAANSFKKDKNDYKYCKTIIILGNIENLHKNTLHALVIYNEALDIALKNSYASLIPHINNNIGVLYIDMEDYINGKLYFEKAYRQFQILKDKKNETFPLMNISIINSKLGYNKEALNFFFKTIKTFLQNNQWELLMSTYVNIAEIYIKENNYIEAEKYINKGLKLIKNNKQPSINFKGSIKNFKSNLYYSAANLYYLKNDYDKSIQFAHKSLKISFQSQDNKTISENAHILYLINYNTKRIDSALYYNNIYFKYNNEFQKENNKNEIIQAKMQYEFKKILRKKELESIKELARNNKTKLIYLIIILFTVLGTFILFLLYKYQKSKTDKLNLKKEKLELEKINLKQDLILKNKDIDYKRKELTSNMMYLVEKNEFIISIAKKLKNLKATESNKSNIKSIQHLIIELNQNSSIKMWDEFEIRFKEVDSEFHENLHKLFPDLTPNELKIATFLRLNMSTKEISAITHQTIRSITIARFRLRKKLKIETEENLVMFLIKL